MISSRPTSRRLFPVMSEPSRLGARLLILQMFEPALDVFGLFVVLAERLGQGLHRVGKLSHFAVQPDEHERRDDDWTAELADPPEKHIFQRPASLAACPRRPWRLSRYADTSIRRS